MRGEVLGHLQDVLDRVYLALTCKTLLGEITLHAFPTEWQWEWADKKRRILPGHVQAVRNAIHAVLGMGLAQWPGVFEYAKFTVYIHVDGSRHYNYIDWHWRVQGTGIYMCLSYHPGSALFYYAAIKSYVPCVMDTIEFPSISCFPGAKLEALKQFIALPRRCKDMH